MTAPKHRSTAIDLLRGLAIVLMALDHALAAFDPNHFVTDSAVMWQPGTPIPTAPFLARWITHFCAPIFVFLAGASLALARARHGHFAMRRATERGVFLALLDPLILTWLWMLIEPMPQTLLFQVISAIGISMLISVAALRWIPSGWRVGIAALYLLAQDAIVWVAIGGDAAALPTGLTAFAITGGIGKGWFVVYPILPWCCVMLLGLRLGEEWLRADDQSAALERRLRYTGIVLLLLFFAVRAGNGYGNLGLYRDDAHWLQWLHCSKYPPSLAFLTMTLGPTCLLLSWFRSRERRGLAWPRCFGPLLILGRAALCFYVAHLALLALLRTMLPLSWRDPWFAWAVAIALPIVLQPLLRWYLAARTARPNGWLRWL